MTAYRGSHPRHHGSGAAGGIPGTRAGGIPDPRYAVVIADFVPPPQKVSPRTQSASGFCPGRYNPLADSVRGDTIRQRILSGETCSASGFCPSSAECVPPPPPLTIKPLHLISERACRHAASYGEMVAKRSDTY